MGFRITMKYIAEWPTLILVSNPGFTPKLTPFKTRCMETYEKLWQDKILRSRINEGF